MKKKLMSVVLAGAMVLSLAACGTTGTTGADTTTSSDNTTTETQTTTETATTEAAATEATQLCYLPKNMANTEISAGEIPLILLA